MILLLILLLDRLAIVIIKCYVVYDESDIYDYKVLHLDNLLNISHAHYNTGATLLLGAVMDRSQTCPMIHFSSK